jgi:hypothetical protein
VTAQGATPCEPASQSAFHDQRLWGYLWQCMKSLPAVAASISRLRVCLARQRSWQPNGSPTSSAVRGWMVTPIGGTAASLPA